jgi:potassium efflux system protein
LRWLTLPGLPLTFVTVFCLCFEEGEWAESLGRIAFILGMLLLASFFHILFYPKGRIFREMQVANSGGWLVRFRHLVYGALAVAPLVLAMLAAIGYFYSAQQLALRIQYTVAVMLGLALAHATLSRWFLVKRRNLAIEQARQRRAEAQEAGATDGSQPPVVTQPERDLAKIHEQLRYLLRYAVTACILTAGWLIWSDVLPALRVLDRAVIWTNRVEVSETIEDASGKPVIDTYEKEVPTTLRHAMTAVLLIVVTYLLGRNLPALLEITVLDRLPVDHGGRHAVSMLVRYIVALTGVVLACRTMSIRWSSVQWLAAAMTVGLGFGLQEIFANLVSGIIILFERPIRVGDIVAVGTVTGTVSQMRMRATTVTDFDRRELIVPNKKFITDDVINWTLSDPINRVVLSVGIAYGSDTALAHSLLRKVAREHPVVLEEPEPSALFRGFGESTLDFDLRVFIPNRNVYPVVLHELNTAIDGAFRDARIEIAFPQRDLNIRAFQQLFPFQPATAESRADAA